jgi:hypothetical protein
MSLTGTPVTILTEEQGRELAAIRPMINEIIEAATKRSYKITSDDYATAFDLGLVASAAKTATDAVFDLLNVLNAHCRDEYAEHALELGFGRGEWSEES